MGFMAIGLMTGSSMDGIDGALLETDGKAIVRFIQGWSVKYSPFFHSLLRTAEFAVQQENGNMGKAAENFPRHSKTYWEREGKGTGSKEDKESFKKELKLLPSENITLPKIVNRLTLLHHEVVSSLLNKGRLKPRNIDIIGFHGQNLYHNPSQKITVQAGDGQLLADLTGVSVINDFRANDVKEGGQGAPFAPLYHQALAVQSGLCPVGVINCGGIANITIITGSGEKDVMGFDAGPGNVLIDRYIRQKTGSRELMDKDGKYGQNGQINYEILSLLKKNAIIGTGEDFLLKRPPKSLDSVNFTLIPELDHLNFEDACATLEAFTAACIADSLDLVDMPVPTTWILAGGGWHNPVIVKFLKQFMAEKAGTETQIRFARELGWDGEFLEAQLFAYLAARSVNGLPLSLPATTGVRRPISGGIKYQPLTNLIDIQQNFK